MSMKKAVLFASFALCTIAVPAAAQVGIGFSIGQSFNGTPTPFLVGTAICAALGFVVIILTEPKRLFARIRIEGPVPSTLDSSLPDDFG